MDKERVKNVVKQMTLEEKTALTQVNGALKTNEVARLKVPSLQLPCELHPFSPRNLTDDAPSFAALGHTFDRELVKAFARVRSRDALRGGESYGGIVSLGVTRRPFAEGMCNAYSEEPLLSAELAAAAIAGSCLPLIGTNLLGVNGLDRRIGERALHEIYLYPFEQNKSKLGGIAVPRGWLNGIPAGENRTFMKSVTSGFDGLVVTEYGCSTDKAEEVSSGHCLDILGTGGDSARLFNAVQGGLLFEKKLDACVERNVYAAAECYNALKFAVAPAVSQNEVDSLYLRLGLESAVLLKNNGLLPLRASDRVVTFGSLVVEGAMNVYVDFSKPIARRTIKAADKARGADKAIVFLPHADGLDGENVRRFVQLVKSYCPVAVVAYAQRYFPLPYLGVCDALVYLPYFGKESVKALHKLLCGERDFSGRLACSWCKSAHDYPADRDAQFAGRDCFVGESVYIGNRYFSSFKSNLLFPFGFGLRYRDVDFGGFKASEKDGTITFSFDVKSREKGEDETVVLISGGFLSDSVYGVGDRLAAFERVASDSDGVRRMQLRLPAAALDVYDAALGKAVPCGGKYEFRIGSSFDVRMNASLKFGKKCKLTGSGEKDVPSYYRLGGQFNLFHRDVEKEVGSPVSVGETRYGAAEKKAADAAVKKAYCPKAVRRDAEAMRRFEKQLARLPLSAKYKLVRVKKEER